MARLTVEDCLLRVDNRFELILKASGRARSLERGANAKVPWENDKPTVVALREIAGGVLDEKNEAEVVEALEAEELQPVSQITLAEAEAELAEEEAELAVEEALEDKLEDVIEEVEASLPDTQADEEEEI